MLCMRCGTVIGEGLTYCDSCSGVARDERQKEHAAQFAERKKQLDAHKAVRAEWWKRILLLAMFAFFLQVGVFLFLIPHSTFPQVSFMALISTTGFFALYYWFLLWIELLQDEPVIGVICLIVPVLAYRTLLDHSERAWKPFVRHIAFAIVTGVGCFAYVGIYRQFPFADLWIIFTGMPPVYDEDPRMDEDRAREALEQLLPQ